MTRPRLLDLFCCEGGAAMGYHRAGFDVVGVDIKPQPRYPFPMVVADALRPPFDLVSFDAIHASPPCQRFSTATANPEAHPDLVDPARQLLESSGLPYVIENVPGAPLRPDVTLCGSMFGMQIRRHRLFELGRWSVVLQPMCAHADQNARGPVIGVVGNGGDCLKPRTGAGGPHRKPRDLDHARDLMGMQWASRKGCVQAIPPAYTEFIGAQLLEHLAAIR